MVELEGFEEERQKGKNSLHPPPPPGSLDPLRTVTNNGNARIERVPLLMTKKLLVVPSLQSLKRPHTDSVTKTFKKLGIKVFLTLPCAAWDEEHKQF